MWVIFPIISSFFYCVAEQIDDRLVDTVIQKKKAAAFAFMRLPSYILAIIILLAIFNRSLFMLPLYNAAGIMLAGAVNVIGQMYLFRALQEGEAVDIKIFGQTGPLVSLGLGVLILGEKIASNQAMGLVLIIIGAAIVALFNDNDKQAPDFRAAGITLVHTLFSILSDILLVYFLRGTGTTDYVLFAQAFFYFQLGCLIFTSFLIICMPSMRKVISRAFLKHKKAALNTSLSMTDNLCFVIADSFYKFALISIPVVAMLNAVAKASGLFMSLFTTLVFSKIFPKIIHRKKISRQGVARYVLSAALITVGIFVMV